MIHIHCTKKLFAKLPLNEQGRLPMDKRFAPEPLLAETTPVENTPVEIKTSENPLSGWHGNLILLQRRNCILLVHDETRLAVFIPCLTKPDYPQLQRHFEDVLMNTLLVIGADHNQMKAATQLLQPLIFDTQCDRSVQGTLNRMKGDIEHMLWFDNAAVSDLSPRLTSAWLAERPCNIKNKKTYVMPDEEMLLLLGGDTQPSRVERDADLFNQARDNGVASDSLPDLPDNVVSLTDYRKEQ